MFKKNQRGFRAKKWPFLANTLTRNTCRSKKFTDKAYNRREVFGQKSGRFWPTLLPEIHVVQKNSQIKRTIAERFSGKKVAVFGQLFYQKYMSFKKIHR